MAEMLSLGQAILLVVADDCLVAALVTANVGKGRK
jgi:hypothetical protein